MPTDWGLEISKFALTPVLAGAGAYIGFLLSNRGKKHDLVYKEKVEAFKALSGDLLRVRKASLLCLTGGLYGDQPSEIEAAEKLLRQYATDWGLAVEDPTVFLGPETRQAMTNVRDMLWVYVTVREKMEPRVGISWMRSVEERDYEWSEEEVVGFRQWGEHLEAVRLAAESTINILYKDIGLPSLRPLFAQERTRLIERVAASAVTPALVSALRRSTVTIVAYDAFMDAATKANP